MYIYTFAWIHSCHKYDIHRHTMHIRINGVTYTQCIPFAYTSLYLGIFSVILGRIGNGHGIWHWWLCPLPARTGRFRTDAEWKQDMQNKEVIRTCVSHLFWCFSFLVVIVWLFECLFDWSVAWLAVCLLACLFGYLVFWSVARLAW